MALPAGFLNALQPAAHAAATFNVNSTGDGADSDVNDGVCDDGAGNCTLRAAVQQATQLAGDDTINLSVNGTITLASALPNLSGLTITGPGPAQLTVRRDPDAATRFRVFTAGLHTTVNLSGVTVSGGRALGEHGGGIFINQGGNVTLTNVVVSDNTAEGGLTTAGRGGGIYSDGSVLTLVNSTVAGNSAANGVFGGSSVGRDGGGIYVNRGTLNVTNSTVSGNRAGNASGGTTAGKGGGLYVGGDAATLTNSTVSDNRSGSGFGSDGGGIFQQRGTLTLNGCTVAHNAAGGGGGGLNKDVNASTALRNTIVANNTANQSPDLRGAYNSQDFNLLENTSDATFSGTTTHNLTGVDPLLSPLQNNGGPTLTHALLPGSPAIDAGDGGALTTDQRGLPRPVDDASAANASDGADIGAYEVQPPPSAGQLQFSAASYTAAEGAGAATVTVTRTGGSAGAVSATFSTSDGTAVAGADYTALPGSAVTFADGDAAPRTVQVTINDDALDEADETVNLFLSNPTGGATIGGSPATAALTITDDDPLPSLSVNHVNVNEGDFGPTPAEFVVSLSAPSGKTVRVVYTTTTFGATATGGVDFMPISATLTFAPGETSKTVSVSVRGDAHVETDETFFLDLSEPSNATISTARGVATIVNDDSPATMSVQFDDPSFPGAENSGTAIVTLYRTGDLSAEASVAYATADGTANERGDYTSAFGRLRFAPGSSFASLTLLVTDDRFAEAGETFSLTLSNPSGVTLGAGSMTTILIRDNDDADGPSPVSDAGFNTSFFIRQHYRDFLNREPDADGLQFWADEINSCGADEQCRQVKRVNVSAAFFLSIEFQETGFLAYRTYKAAFGDTTSPNVAVPVPVVRFHEFLADAQAIGRDVRVGVGDWFNQLETNKNAYVLEFVRRQRFTDAFPLSMTPAEFVDKLNLNAGGVLSPAERDQLVAELSAATDATQGRAAALRRVAEDADLRRLETNRAFVLMQYFGYLRRNPDDPQDADFRGWEFWLGKLNQFNGNFIDAEMVRAFLSSIEYNQRFGR